MLFDYHAHTPRCGHAAGPMEDYVERALELGMGEFGFSEHSPWMVQDPGDWTCLRWEELPEYIADVRRLQERYDSDRFKLRLGFEADFVPSRLDIARETINDHPWDYVIGSVHHLGFWCLPKTSHSSEYAKHHAADVCEFYYYFMREMIRARFCDIIAHLDLPKKHGMNVPGGMLRYVEPLIPEIKANDIAVEINTSGLDAKTAEPLPGWEIIEALHAAGVPLLVNSDSHKPAHVGRHFAAVLDRLRAMGVTNLVRFQDRQMSPTPLAVMPQAAAS